jgi:putative transposase
VHEIDYNYPSGVAIKVFMDRGSDWDSDQVRYVLGSFGTIAEYEPVACPFYKGAIERWNRTLQEEVSHTAPGATPPWDIDGYVWDGEGKAYLTFSAYVRRLWRWVTMIYAKTWHRGIGDVPLNRWKESVARKTPRGLRSKDDLSILCNRVADCGVSNKGVEHEGLSWGGKYIEKIMAHPSFRPGMKVKIRIDDEDVQNAWVINPFTAANEKLDPVLKTYMPGLNWYAHDMARKDSAVREKTARKESSMVASKRRQRLQAERLIEDGKPSGKAQTAAGRYMGVGSRAPCGDSTGGVLPDPDAAVSDFTGDCAVAASAEIAAAVPETLEVAPAPAAAAPARMTRRVRNH